MGSFIKERLIYARCWTYWAGRCNGYTCDEFVEIIVLDKYKKMKAKQKGMI